MEETIKKYLKETGELVKCNHCEKKMQIIFYKNRDKNKGKIHNSITDSTYEVENGKIMQKNKNNIDDETIKEIQKLEKEMAPCGCGFVDYIKRIIVMKNCKEHDNKEWSDNYNIYLRGDWKKTSPHFEKNKNNIDEVLEKFDKLYPCFMKVNHSIERRELFKNFIKQKLQQVEARKVEEIISKIKKFEIPENAEVVNGDDVDIKSFQNILIDLILKELIKNK